MKIFLKVSCGGRESTFTGRWHEKRKNTQIEAELGGWWDGTWECFFHQYSGLFKSNNNMQIFINYPKA